MMVAAARCSTLALFALLATVDAQLRPRRVGTNALGDQEVVLTDVPSGGGDMGGGTADPMAGMAQGMAQGLRAMTQAMGEDGENFNPAELLKNMDFANNPMLKAVADANPEMAKLLNDPEALQGQMEQMAKMMASPEGQQMAQTMMKEMQSVMTDPDKLKAGLEQLGSNPALKGIADAVPGLREVLEDPEALAEQASKAAELFQSFSDPEKAQELLSSLGGGEGGEMMQNLQKLMSGEGGGEGLTNMASEMQQAMKRMQALMGEGADGDGMGDLLDGLDGEGLGGDSTDNLKARVREQMAEMMHKRRGGAGGAIDEDEF